jgi:hypothetical protein
VWEHHNSCTGIILQTCRVEHIKHQKLQTSVIKVRKGSDKAMLQSRSEQSFYSFFHFSRPHGEKKHLQIIDGMVQDFEANLQHFNHSKVSENEKKRSQRTTEVCGCLQGDYGWSRQAHLQYSSTHHMVPHTH